MEFEVLFADGTIKWRTWDYDLFNAIPYEDFCRSKMELYPLIFSAADAKKEIARLNNQPITAVCPGDIVYIDLRCYGAAWYDTLRLPDHHHLTYVTPLRYTKWGNAKHTKLDGRVDLFNEHWTSPKSLTGSFVYLWGSNKQFSENSMVLLTPTMVQEYKLQR
jgi:hypothetical protein